MPAVDRIDEGFHAGADLVMRDEFGPRRVGFAYRSVDFGPEPAVIAGSLVFGFEL
ncbi:Uncharacterised protein [Bordetella ansorpii]|uniref:Uncharacterized protein n=1 Tax=Bordetella ansorpii TaxID=288768 RepID=A0A157SRD0_9BORD|nr:Uncharacterised protein [Bordetella ansorpii]